MPGHWADNLGVIDLVLEGETNKWKVVSSRAEARPIFDKKNDKSLVDAKASLVKTLEQAHNDTREFVNKPIGTICRRYQYLSVVSAGFLGHPDHPCGAESLR
ncbi:2',3'-cyclic-nucleotide 2'-phosphodiesterase/3'-nucleotidase precursor [Serratia fonticola]|uniref:2',3'-cyclic-nucleotide 2'-phosphodiesterase/3'-nucleotidase n=1 Tax=Serratia fonticola TaxID=47917 RepID=A0A4U9TZY9_SERFO|nr:2',3'-cyclic-nucleotide 2'-phosphodiesterase/3'-nucleotidase precursor [Serratia fonticola]